ncbi:MAG TPA: adenosine deaminase [Dehalococcoidia bacterium]|nr:adenosine deaminase [Dehalococcoidia bacterium]
MQPEHAVPHDLRDLPKAELHVHLEGSVRPATLEEFASREGISVPPFSDLTTFIDTFSAAYQAMVRPGDYRRMMREYCEDAVRSGVRYAEVQLRTAPRGYDCLAEAVEESQRHADITVRFVASIPRHLPLDAGWAMLDGARGCDEVVAVSLGGVEAGYPPEPFAELFAEARLRGLRSIPHAGEDAGPESIRGALDALGADRIQHGIRAVEDAALVRELAGRRIPLDVCLTSNVRLAVVGSYERHPLRTLWDAGVTVSVNTDDPGFFGCDIAGEYAIAGRLLGLDRAGYARLARNSLDASFAPDGLTSEMHAEIDDWEQRAGR